jgi:hypothetical protein
LTDWKRGPRIVDPDAGWRKIRIEGECRLCGHVPSGHPLDKLNRMHVVPRSQGGDDVDDNFVPGCGSGTTGCHGLLTAKMEIPSHPEGFTVADALDAMNRSLTDRERRYAAAEKDPDWIDRTYPRRSDESQ